MQDRVVPLEMFTVRLSHVRWHVMAVAETAPRASLVHRSELARRRVKEVEPTQVLGGKRYVADTSAASAKSQIASASKFSAVKRLNSSCFTSRHRVRSVGVMEASVSFQQRCFQQGDEVLAPADLLEEIRLNRTQCTNRPKRASENHWYDAFWGALSR